MHIVPLCWLGWVGELQLLAAGILAAPGCSRLKCHHRGVCVWLPRALTAGGCATQLCWCVCVCAGVAEELLQPYQLDTAALAASPCAMQLVLLPYGDFKKSKGTVNRWGIGRCTKSVAIFHFGVMLLHAGLL